ncbi:hypothetical protein F4556_005414 [Kitasatospora gansuensis]|uniref:DUF11 domain-containing protein n=1 Tax=Kitasatospora gansuensis TaxID=258050 RepID=A0A7W7SG66_9ACTN|nr:hypothetical protein [Kitasatospora gansuensis]MBB4949879.1 hypothetical protein [Kitasatospora gansuensis]
MARKLATVAAVCCVLVAVVAAAPAAPAAGRPGAGVRPGLHLPAPPVDRARAGQLKVMPQDTDPVPAGELATVRALVVNDGSDRSQAFTVVVTLPQGTTPEEPFFPENCAVDGLTVTCHYRKGLPAGNSAIAIIPARLAADATGVLNGGSATVSEDTAPDAADTGYYDVPVADAVLS